MDSAVVNPQTFKPHWSVEPAYADNTHTRAHTHTLTFVTVELHDPVSPVDV